MNNVTNEIFQPSFVTICNLVNPSIVSKKTDKISSLPIGFLMMMIDDNDSLLLPTLPF